MTQPTVRADNEADNEAETTIGDWYEGRDRRNGIRIELAEDGAATMILIRAGVDHPIADITYTDTNTTVTYNKRGLEEPQYLRDRWDSWVYSALTHWRRRAAA